MLLFECLVELLIKVGNNQGEDISFLWRPESRPNAKNVAIERIKNLTKLCCDSQCSEEHIREICSLL